MATEKRLIDANYLVDKRIRNCPIEEGGIPLGDFAQHQKILALYPTVDAVSRGVHDQVRWERDTAIGQLEEHGIPFGGIAPDVVKVVRCKDCKSSRKLNNNESLYLVDECLICTNCEATDHGWNPVFPTHFCSYGERRTNNE